MPASSLAVAIASGFLIACTGIGASSAAPGEENSIASLIPQWFASLEAQPSQGWAIETFLAESPLTFSLTQAETSHPEDFADWLSALRSTHPEVEFRLDKLRVVPLDENLVRVRFEFERHAVDAAGLPHLSRREQTWLVRELPGQVPEVLRIKEQRLLAFPGTGPQIVCY